MTDLEKSVPEPGSGVIPVPLLAREPDGSKQKSSLLMPALVAVSVAAHLAVRLPEAEIIEETAVGESDEDKKITTKQEAKPKKDLLKDEPEERIYGAVGEVVRRQVYGDGETTQANLDELIGFYLRVFESREEKMYLMDALGHELLAKEFPNNWFAPVPTGRTVISGGRTVAKMKPMMTNAEKNAWQNELRRQIPEDQVPAADRVLAKDFQALGYPFVASAVLPGIAVINGEEEKSLMEIILERLKANVSCPGVGNPGGPRHLEGKSMPLYEAILKIADAYDIPHAIALGIAANESGYDKLAISPANAYGIYQLQSSGDDSKPEAYEMAKRYAKQHPEFSGKIRKGELKDFKSAFNGVIEWKNRLVQTEMFCAYFRFIQEQLRGTVDELEARLQTLDPSYLMGTLSLISAITAYNAGATGIKKTMLRFLKLSDSEMLEMLGKPPYGIDVWQAVLANSFDRATKPDGRGNTGQKLHVFTYAAKVLAMGARIMEDENILDLIAKHGQGDAEAVEKPVSAVPLESVGLSVESSSEASRFRTYLAYVETALVAVLTGVQSGKEGREVLGQEGLSRRAMLLGGAAIAGVSVPLVRAVANVIEFGEGGAEAPTEMSSETQESMPYPVYPEALADGRKRLKEIYAKIKKEGLSVEQPLATEANRKGSNWKTPARVAKLKPLMRKVFGAEWDVHLNTGRALPKKFFTTQQAKQEAYLQSALASGDTLPIKAESPEQPFFCQQVGEDSGISNNPDSMYVHKEMLPVVGTLIALVNDQIDAFNADPKSFGIHEKKFPKIPHVLSIKASGAHRNVKDRHAGSTPSFSDHWTDTCLDILALSRSEGAAAFAFKEALVYKGDTLVPAGGKVPTRGRPKRTREIVMMMIERALLVLEDSLKGRPGHPEIMPRFEGKGSPYHSNWHVALVPSSIANPSEDF